MKEYKTRRDFLAFALATGWVLPLSSFSLLGCSSKEKSTKEAKKLKILILGGTSFLGPHQIAYALSRGHSVSIFTRGKTKPSIYAALFEKVEHLIGDRENDLTALENRQWDVVIDNSGRKVEWTKQSAALLKDKVDLYLYTSSTGVYYPYLGDDIKEDTDVLLATPEEITDEQLKSSYSYGVMKANSELEARRAFGADRTIVIRPTYMIGPADKTNRFIHWPIRLSKGGETMVPGKSDDLVQYVDVRDVAEWMIRLIEQKNTGTFNAVGPKEAQNIHDFVEEAKKAFDVTTSFVKIDDYDFLKKKQIFHIVPWIMQDEEYVGTAKINPHKGIANGLSFRPLLTTVKDTYDWWYSDAVTQEKREEYELDPKSLLVKESAILQSWKAVSAKERK